MPFVDTADVDPRSPLPGWSGRFVDGENLTVVHWQINDGAHPLHEHEHMQEEIWNVVEGEIEIKINGVAQTAGPGCVALIPPNTRHSARPLGPASVIVIDYPKREPFGEPVPKK
jgi:mannose-6-phosphate isomerase-like protein (cupin superfamily)